MNIFLFLIIFLQPKKGKSSKEVDKELKFKKIASAALNKGCHSVHACVCVLWIGI